VAPVNRILPGTPEFTDLVAQFRSGANDRNLNDENPFDQVNALKQAGFGTLLLPGDVGGPTFSVGQLFSAVIDVASADPIVAHIV
jgi:alkylation response protein AidB-like acyl-CoA dehydrogenase